MKRIDKILLATDFSKGSRKALEIARKIAIEDKSTIVILHVVDEREVQAIIEAANWMLEESKNLEEAFFERIEKEAKTEISSLLRLLENNGIPTRVLIEKGHPVEKICEIAEREKVDLVAVGYSGKHSRSTFGSTAERVVRDCSVSVLVAK